MVLSLSRKNKGLLSGLLLLLIGVAMAAYSGYKMKIEVDNIYFWIFWLGVLLIIGSIIYLLHRCTMRITYQNLRRSSSTVP